MGSAGVIEADHYRETRKTLMADPIIGAMAMGLPGGLEEAETSGFMQAALSQYHKRGGQVQTHIGGPAEAIKALLSEAQDSELNAAQICKAHELGMDPKLAERAVAAKVVEEDAECQGHQSLAGAHMGETVFCDGSCRVQA